MSKFGKGLGVLCAALALGLTPYRIVKDEEQGSVELRSLLLTVEKLRREGQKVFLLTPLPFLPRSSTPQEVDAKLDAAVARAAAAAKER